MDETLITARSVFRTISIGVLAGAVSGLVVGGMGGRVLMFVLAQLNPEDAGIQTDDDFPIGEFTVSGTLNLFVIATVIGVIGGLILLVVRGLRFGPRWFRVLSMPLGATMVLGASLVHSDGVDFTRLRPLGVALTIPLAVPFLYTLMAAWLVDRWLDREPWVWSRLPAAIPWIARAVLAAFAVFTFVDLLSTIDEILHPFQFD